MDIDDIFALQAIASDPDFILRGVCVCNTGFASVQGGVDSVLRILSFMGNSGNGDDKHKNLKYLLNVPVAYGSLNPVDSDINFKIGMNDNIRNKHDSIFNTKDKHFPNNDHHHHGLKPSNLSCTDLYLSINKKYKKMNILSTGPATDLAILLLNDKNNRVLDNIELVSQMGGTINSPGNIFTYPNNTVSEMNLFLDVKSFSIIVEILKEKLIIIPLDPINLNPITRDFYYNVLISNKKTTKSSDWLKSLYLEVFKDKGEKAFFNDDLIFGKGTYTYDFEAYRALKNNGCEVEQLSSIYVDYKSTPPFNPNGKISIVNDHHENKTRLCMIISPFLSNLLFTQIYTNILP